MLADFLALTDMQNEMPWDIPIHDKTYTRQLSLACMARISMKRVIRDHDRARRDGKIR